MITIYLDDCVADNRVARALRAAGLSVFLPSELGTQGVEDELHLGRATELSAALFTFDISDFTLLHRIWQERLQEHAGILVSHQVASPQRIQWLLRAATMLTPEKMRGQCLHLEMFRDDELARAAVESLG